MSEVIRGDTSIWTLPLLDDQGAPYMLHGCTVWVTVKRSQTDPDSEALYQHVISLDDAGIVQYSDGMTLGPDGPEGGIVIQELTPQESAAFEVGDFVYDVQVGVPVEGADPPRLRVYTLINGERETIVGDITRATEPPEVTP